MIGLVIAFWIIVAVCVVIALDFGVFVAANAVRGWRAERRNRKSRSGGIAIE